MANNLIPAATILLLRDEPSFEVLMIERHKDISFAGGAMVFPGGKIDPGDGDKGWADHCDGLNAIIEEERAPRIAAIREAFEETGVLLARDENGALLRDERVATLQSWRRRIETDDAQFIALAKQEGLRLACDALQLFARWQPPQEARHQRYHTWFFAAQAPYGQTAREDGNEATDAVWIEPQAVLAARERGERKMIFPTSRNVELLTCSNSVKEVFKFAGQRRITPIEPRFVRREDGAFVTIPEGLGYPITEESAETAFRL